ncbi:hypothetical protein PRUPE_6G184300 [Prunus persica]|uniref:Uncharacterized protein n=1 Tax=Prunus persica TaxID=3760 RepID=A0A251NV10_PRUPE|nr:hypothetical protein PRUPE_6G184300 [Prunus persica]
MNVKNKGKVHPSPSSPSSSMKYVYTLHGLYKFDNLSPLPAAILTLASVLSLEDREVLAYLITRSMKTTPNISSISAQDPKKKSSKKGPKSTSTSTHQPQMFDCDCFDCYRSYWFKWDSSPNREPIHQAIEASEDHLANGEKTKKNSDRDFIFLEENAQVSHELAVESSASALLPENDVVLVGSNEKADGVEENDGKVEDLGEETHAELVLAYVALHNFLHKECCSDEFPIEPTNESSSSSSAVLPFNEDDTFEPIVQTQEQQ